MKSAYIALDIETTGLDPETCQILEIGAVYNDMSRPVAKCQTFERLIDHKTITGSPYALRMNANLISRIADGEGVDLDGAVADLMCWITYLANRDKFDTVHLVGKNVGSFDVPFLKRVPSWQAFLFHYRCLEVGSMYATPDGISGQAELIANIERMYEIPGREHEALHDAMVSLALVRDKWTQEGLFEFDWRK